MTIKSSPFSFFSRRIIPVKHLQNVPSVSEEFHFIRYIHMRGPSQLLIMKNNLQREKKPKPPQNLTLPPNPQAVQDECKVVLGTTQ